MNEISLVTELLIELTKMKVIDFKIKASCLSLHNTTKPLHSLRKNNLIDVENPYSHKN